ncbi:hypothetical protein W97_05061 [Coniosporium apollinis CBS 100218]|uniref:Uncharacterized protein n=1 Tax=Coniosporium apollinis (strain CBS 100218) TaxID=1168221 RepID=R7YV87_CONA1|nr:uncharacterized protein W97_05061 [Coniosporium apollinis CBS 100218]EON65822.1 hypothetical protein W97_05061 [Coniosporium apollinis CBS 100218]
MADEGTSSLHKLHDSMADLSTRLAQLRVSSPKKGPLPGLATYNSPEMTPAKPQQIETPASSESTMFMQQELTKSGPALGMKSVAVAASMAKSRSATTGLSQTATEDTHEGRVADQCIVSPGSLGSTSSTLPQRADLQDTSDAMTTRVFDGGMCLPIRPWLRSSRTSFLAYNPVLEQDPQIITQVNPDVILHIGLAAGRSYFMPEWMTSARHRPSDSDIQPGQQPADRNIRTMSAFRTSSTSLWQVVGFESG